MNKGAIAIVAAGLLTACTKHPQPFLYPTQERAFVRALGEIKRHIQRNPDLLPDDATGALFAVSLDTTPPIVSKLASGGTPHVAVSALLDSAPSTQACGSTSRRMVLFVPSRTSGLPLSMVECKLVLEQVVQSRSNQALVDKIATDLATVRSELDSLAARVSRDENLLAQSVTIDIIQQDLLTSRGTAIDSLQARVRDTAQRLRRLSSSTKALADSLSKHWIAIDEKLYQLKTAIEAIR